MQMHVVKEKAIQMYVSRRLLSITKYLVYYYTHNNPE